MPALEMTEVTKAYGAAPSRWWPSTRDHDGRRRRDRRAAGAVRLRQDDAADARRRPPPPTSGTICVAGRDLADVKDSQLPEIRRLAVGFVFQSVNLVPFLNARENLLAVRGLGGGRIDRGARQRADQLLDGARARRPGRQPAGRSSPVASGNGSPSVGH
jgi:hypothetical protein